MIIAVTNLKGGVGKSTIARNLAVYFSEKGAKVCIVDTDLQQRTTCDWIERRADDVPHIAVFPMTTVEGLPKDIRNHDDNGYEIIIVDGVPQLDEVLIKTILLSDLLVIPITPSIDDIKSFQRFLSVYDKAKIFRENIPAYMILNKFNAQINEDKEVREAVNLFEEFGVKSLDATLKYRVAHRTASKHGLTAVEWTDKKAKAEVIDMGKEIQAILGSLLS